MSLQQDILDLIKKASLRNYSKQIKNNIELLQRILDETSKYNMELSIPEMVYLILNPMETPFCHRGNKKVFNSVEKGYRFCGNKKSCLCNQENQKEKMTIVQSKNH